jgi:hypothetical protein
MVSAQNNVLTFNEEPLETGGTFDGTKFTASVAGWFFVFAAVRPNTSNSVLTVALRKNGSSIQWGNGKSGTQDSLLLAASMVYLNGSTDYVEAVLYSSIAQPLLYSNETPHQFCGFKVA